MNEANNGNPLNLMLISSTFLSLAGLTLAMYINFINKLTFKINLLRTAYQLYV